jgi:hypothetical protein
MEVEQRRHPVRDMSTPSTSHAIAMTGAYVLRHSPHHILATETTEANDSFDLCLYATV